MNWQNGCIKGSGNANDAQTAAMIVEYCEPSMDDVLNESTSCAHMPGIGK